MSNAATTVLMAVVRALDAAGVGGSSGRAKTFEYDINGEVEEGVEITLLYPKYAAIAIEAAAAGETPKDAATEGESAGQRHRQEHSQKDSPDV